MPNEIRLRNVPTHILKSCEDIGKKEKLQTNTQVLEFMLEQFPKYQKKLHDQQQEIYKLQSQLRNYEATQGQFRRNVQDFSAEFKREAGSLVKFIQQHEKDSNVLLKKLYGTGTKK